MDRYRKHGLTGRTRRLVFDALFEKQQGKCFICGITQAELEAKYSHLVQQSLHIDHCHTTGMIRGLLCRHCNSWMGYMECHAFRRKPDGETEEDFARYCEDIAAHWLGVYWDAIFAYMQQERWLPQKDILFHLQMKA